MKYHYNNGKINWIAIAYEISGIGLRIVLFAIWFLYSFDVIDFEIAVLSYLFLIAMFTFEVWEKK